MKNILFIDHHAELGGGEIALLEIIKNIDKDRFSLFAYLGNGGPFADELRKYKVDVIIDKLPGYFRRLDRDPHTKNRPLDFIKSAFLLSSFAKRTGTIITEAEVDVVYANSVKSLLYAARAASATKRKAIWHLHDCLSADFYPRWTIPLIISASRAVDNIICVSNVAADYFEKAGGKKEKASVIYNGVDTARFNPAVSSEIIKNQLNLMGQKIVSIVSRLEPWKGQDIFIKAAKIICSKRNDTHFLITGAPLFGFNKYENELKLLVKQLGLKDKINFLGFRYDIENIYAASDIIVHCSVRPEPFGRDIIEAMACAKPVISTKVGAAQEIIEDGNDGLLVKPNNPEDLSCNILKLIDNTQLPRRLGINARKKVQELFDITKIVRRIEQLF